MKPLAFYTDLKQSIEKAYAKAALSVLHKRMELYKRQSHSNNQSLMHDIKPLLLESAQYVSVQTHAQEFSQVENHKEIHHRYSADDNKDLDEASSSNISDLSRYFKSRTNGTGLHDGIKDKLEHSVWGHIHATMRCMQRSDRKNADLHADIACNACRELSHYMSEQQYQALITEIEHHLNESCR